MSKATKRIAVLVSGGGTNLQALINAENKGITCKLNAQSMKLSEDWEAHLDELNVKFPVKMNKDDMKKIDA